MTIVASPRSTAWRRVDALPSEMPVDPTLPHETTDAVRLRQRLENLLSTLAPGEMLFAQVVLTPGAAAVGIGLASGGAADAAERLHRALDDMLALSEDVPEGPLPFRAALRPSPLDAPASSALPWPTAGIDVDGLLGAAHRVTGRVVVEVMLSPSMETIEPVALQRWLRRRAERQPIPDIVEALASGVSSQTPSFMTTVEATATDAADLDHVRRALCQGVEVVAEAPATSVDRVAVERLIRGELVHLIQAARLVPIAALAPDSLAPVPRRSALRGGARSAGPGDLILGAGRGGIPVGIPGVDLFQHLGVYGRQGFGKTTTMHGLLRELACSGIPFLVVDPLKLDYVPLIAELATNADAVVWHLGAARSPAVNLLAPPPGVSPIDYAGVFAGAFAQASKLDEFPLAVAFLRPCLERVYVRWLAERRPGWPPLAELYDEVRRAGRAADSRSRNTVEVVTSLTARLEALVSGSAGRLLLGGADAGIDWAQLTARPTLISLTAISDPTSRNTVFALLMAAFLAYRRRVSATAGHLLVLEEAHALFPHGASDDEGLLSMQLASAIATLRAQKQGIALVTQSPTQLPPLIRGLVATRLSLRVDDDGADLLSPGRPDAARRLTALGRGEVALWSASGDPQATFFRATPPVATDSALVPPEVTGSATIVPLSPTLLSTSTAAAKARTLGAQIAATLSTPATDLRGLLREAEARTSAALSDVPATSSSRSDLARAVLTAALQRRLADDPILHSYAVELAASSALVRSLENKEA